MYGYFGDVTEVSQYQDLLEGLIDAVESLGPFDGIMGFSEGGIVGATLLLEDARRPFANFKCGIFFSAAPPLDPDALRDGIIGCLDPTADAAALSHVPTAHIYSHVKDTTGSGIANVQSPLHGLWVEAGWGTPEQLHGSLSRICGKSEVFVHDHGHRVPGSTDPQGLRGALRAIDRTIKSATGG
nr:EF-hand calcium-binding domain protein [Colletotrichum truncatum]KAF6789199.1 EF-hand calcium-binding domain protein [Colletotrichum truncatum]